MTDPYLPFVISAFAVTFFTLTVVATVYLARYRRAKAHAKKNDQQ